MSSKTVLFLAGIAIGASVVTSDACSDPKSVYYSGAVLNNSEYVDFSLLESMGTDGVNYLRECDTSVRIGDSLTLHPDGLPAQLPADRVFDPQIRLQWDMLNISFRYSGGCREHLFELHTTGRATSSGPAEISLVLSHDEQHDPCDGIVAKSITFDLSPLRSLVLAGSETTIVLKLPGGASLKFTWTPTPYFSCMYKYRCHSVESAMVYLGYFTLGYGDAQPCPKMAVYFDTTSIPTSAQKADAVAEELRWLTDHRVITGLSASKIARIQSKLTVAPHQYWSLQDSVLPYNMWFIGDSDSLQGWRTNGVKGGCGLGIVYSLLPQPLVSNPVAIKTAVGKTAPLQGPVVLSNRCRIIIQFPFQLDAKTFVKVYNLIGGMVAILKPVAGSRSIEWDRRMVSGHYASPGTYFLKYSGVPFAGTKIMIN